AERRRRRRGAEPADRTGEAKMSDQCKRRSEPAERPASPGGVEVKDPGDPSSEAAEVPGSPPTSVDCPICQLSFPASDIEMHAAFCNGGVPLLPAGFLGQRCRTPEEPGCCRFLLL
uniref:UBZ4-type domain-containing protein n=1 Tax=Oryzias sinensis TaxID=183150 RepID=A0A8C7WYA0_9TELE